MRVVQAGNGPSPNAAKYLHGRRGFVRSMAGQCPIAGQAGQAKPRATPGRRGARRQISPRINPGLACPRPAPRINPGLACRGLACRPARPARPGLAVRGLACRPAQPRTGLPQPRTGLPERRLVGAGLVAKLAHESAPDWPARPTPSVLDDPTSGRGLAPLVVALLVSGTRSFSRSASRLTRQAKARIPRSCKKR